MKKLIVASSNKGKLKEIAEIFKDYYEIVSMKEMGYTQVSGYLWYVFYNQLEEIK